MSSDSSQTVLIDGRWRSATTGETLPVIDPSTGERFAALARGRAEDVSEAVAAARTAFDDGPWGRMPAAERGRILSRFGRAIADDFDTLVALEARDTGKPLKQARADITACSRYFEYYGGAADKHHGISIPYQDGFTVFTVKEPYGVTGNIIPWNYPAQVFGRTIGGALAAGNACVLKPAEEACQTPLRLAALALEAGLPEGALNIVTKEPTGDLGGFFQAGFGRVTLPDVKGCHVHALGDHLVNVGSHCGDVGFSIKDLDIGAVFLFGVLFGPVGLGLMKSVL